MQRYDFSSDLIANLKLNYKLEAEDHSFNTFVAGEVSESKNNWFNAERRNFVSSAVD